MSSEANSAKPKGFCVSASSITGTLSTTGFAISKAMKTFNKLIIPSILLLIFLIPSLYQDQLTLEIQDDYFQQILKVSRCIFGSCLWLSAGWLVIRVLNLIVWPAIIERRIGRQVPTLLKDLVAVLIIISAVAGILSSVFEKSLSGLIAASGVAGLVIGFAVKEVISDFFSGIVLNISPPYQIGDWIKLENDEWDGPSGPTWDSSVAG